MYNTYLSAVAEVEMSSKQNYSSKVQVNLFYTSSIWSKKGIA